MSGISLRKKPSGWEFVSEAALEKFVWTNLLELFGVNPLKQQYITNGEICDILAIDQEGGLVILELKNTEDRYLIQQLTRYYASLLEEKPFQENIDYTRPVQLVAIAPTYHRHNLVDRHHSTLDFKLLQFSIAEENESCYFVLRNLELETVQRHLIPYSVAETPIIENIPEPPDVMLEWLGGCSLEEQTGFLKVRNKILSHSTRMKEMVDKRVIQYGSGKTKLCAEIRFQQKVQRPILFLWLPTPSTLWRSHIKQPMIGRLRVWTNGEAISHIGHVPEGLGKMKLESEWNQLPQNQRPKGLTWSLSSKSHMPTQIEGYVNHCENQNNADYWDILSDLAVSTFCKRS